MNKVYLVWRYYATEQEMQLDSIFAPHGNESNESVKERAKKYADEMQAAWGDINPDDYFEVEGRETD